MSPPGETPVDAGNALRLRGAAALSGASVAPRPAGTLPGREVCPRVPAVEARAPFDPVDLLPFPAPPVDVLADVLVEVDVVGGQNDALLPFWILDVDDGMVFRKR